MMIKPFCRILITGESETPSARCGEDTVIIGAGLRKACAEDPCRNNKGYRAWIRRSEPARGSGFPYHPA